MKISGTNVLLIQGTVEQVGEDVEFRIGPDEKKILITPVLPGEIIERLQGGRRAVTLTAVFHADEYSLDDQIVDLIIQVVGEHFKMTFKEMKAVSRKRETVIPRQLCMQQIRQYTYPRKSLEWIGMQFGKDHATVVNASKAIAGWMTDKSLGWGSEIRKAMEEISRRITLLKSQHDVPDATNRRAS